MNIWEAPPPPDYEYQTLSRSIDELNSSFDYKLGKTFVDLPEGSVFTEVGPSLEFSLQRYVRSLRGNNLVCKIVDPTLSLSSENTILAQYPFNDRYLADQVSSAKLLSSEIPHELITFLERIHLVRMIAKNADPRAIALQTYGFSIVPGDQFDFIQAIRRRLAEMYQLQVLPTKIQDTSAADVSDSSLWIDHYAAAYYIDGTDELLNYLQLMYCSMSAGAQSYVFPGHPLHDAMRNKGRGINDLDRIQSFLRRAGYSLEVEQLTNEALIFTKYLES